MRLLPGDVMTSKFMNLRPEIQEPAKYKVDFIVNTSYLIFTLSLLLSFLIPDFQDFP